jgi:hypothetical protein
LSAQGWTTHYLYWLAPISVMIVAMYVYEYEALRLANGPDIIPARYADGRGKDHRHAARRERSTKWSHEPARES